MDLDIPSGQMGAEFRRDCLCVRSGQVDVHFEFGAQRVHDLFPAFHQLDLVEQQESVLFDLVPQPVVHRTFGRYSVPLRFQIDVHHGLPFGFEPFAELFQEY